MSRDAQVICAGISYFEVAPVLTATGDPQKDKKGDPVEVTLRKEAALGDVVELTDYEYERLEALGAVREPSDAPLPGQENYTTPFSAPVAWASQDEPKLFEGPVMGDPNPGGGTARIGGLTPEEAAEFERRAFEDSDADPEIGETVVPPGSEESTDGSTVGVQSDSPSAIAGEVLTEEQRERVAAGKDPGPASVHAPDGFDVEGATPKQIEEHIDEEGLNVDETVALAGDDPKLAKKVLRAEERREAPRVGVLNKLEALAG